MPTNVDANQRYAAVIIDLPEKAKDATIKTLSEQVEVQKVLLKSFRKRLLAKLKDNIHLKTRLAIDCEPEKLEYNNLIGDGDDSENSDLDKGKNEVENENVDCADPLAQSNTESHAVENSGEENSSESDDGDDDCDKSTYYPDKHPISLDSFADDPEAGGS